MNTIRSNRTWALCLAGAARVAGGRGGAGAAGGRGAPDTAGAPAAALKTCRRKWRLPGLPQPLPLHRPAPTAPAAKPRPPLKSIGPDTNGGFLIAYDPATGTERWRVPGGSAIGGGTVATGGGLVFQATQAAPFMPIRRTKARSCWNSRPAFPAAWVLPSRSWWMASSTSRCRLDKAAPVRARVATRRRRIRTRRLR